MDFVTHRNAQASNPRNGLFFHTQQADGGVVHVYSDGLRVFVPHGHTGLEAQHVHAGPVGHAPMAYSGGLGALLARAQGGSAPPGNARRS